MKEKRSSVLHRMTARWVRRGLLAFVFFRISTMGIAYGQLLPFRSYTVREGLLSDGITTLYQDSYGNLWIGTTDGISVYDGEVFKNYTVVNGLASSWVNCIVEDRFHKGVMWIGTLGGGVSRFANGAFSNYKLGNSDWSERVNSISQGDDGTLYCATADGVFMLVGGVSSRVARKFSGRPFNQVSCEGDSLLILDSYGSLTSYNLANGETHFLTDRWMKSSAVSVYALGKLKKLWLGLSNGTIVDYSDNKAMVAATSVPATFLLDDGRGNLWIGGSDGLYKVDQKRFGTESPIHYTTLNGLPSNNVFSGLYDTEGDLWLGSGSLCKLGNQNTGTFKTGVSWQVIDNSEAASDDQGHIWAITAKGLLEVWRDRSGGIADYLHTFDRLRLRHPILSFRITDGSNIWLCSQTGAFRSFVIQPKLYGPSVLRYGGTYSAARWFRPNTFLCFMVDRENRIWCSLNGIGLLMVDANPGKDEGAVKLITQNLPDKSIRAMFEDSSGNLWFGGYLGGLAEISHPFTKEFSTRLYTVADGLADNSVRAIADDAKGNIWIGTRFGGLSIMRDGRFENITAQDGLISNGVWAICRDGEKGIMVGTQLGVQRITIDDPGNRSLHLAGERVPVYSLGVSNSRLEWICTDAGTTINDLARQNFTRSHPVVKLARFLVNGEELPITQNARMAYNKNTVTFVFAGISLRDGKDLAYRYSLAGVDNGWRYAPHAHAVTYVSLKPGNYTFRVRAVELSGIQSSNVASLSFSIVPPYWRRWWFIFGAAIILGSMVYTVIKIRVNRLLEIERVRARIATDLHDDIGSGLTRIAVMAEVAARQTEINGSPSAISSTGNGSDEGYSAHKLVERIGANARELVGSMSDVVWSVDPKNLTVGDLLKRLRSFAFEISEAKGIAVEFNADEKIESMKVDPQILRALLLISKEGLNNAIKYSRCMKVSVSLQVSDNCIRLNLMDDGCGFDGASQKLGHGLENMRMRAKKAGGKFDIKSSSGNGTIIGAELPLRA